MGDNVVDTAATERVVTLERKGRRGRNICHSKLSSFRCLCTPHFGHFNVDDDYLDCMEKRLPGMGDGQGHMQIPSDLAVNFANSKLTRFAE